MGDHQLQSVSFHPIPLNHPCIYVYQPQFICQLTIFPQLEFIEDHPSSIQFVCTLRTYH